MGLKDLFIISDDADKKKETKEVVKEKATTKFPVSENTNPNANNAFGFGSNTPAPSLQINSNDISQEHLNKFLDMYQKGFDALNQDGYDFYEFFQSVCEGDIGFVDQKYTLFRNKTVTQICRYALRKSTLTKPEKEELITKYLSDWGLEEHKDKYSCELSGGQRQRTAIIEQMLSSKHFMILDEPFSGLDVGNIEKVKASFERISNDNEFNTTIFSTHDIKLAVEMADSIYIVGFPEGTTEYSTIVKHYDLKAMGLAWQPYGEGHRQLCADIKELLLRS